MTRINLVKVEELSDQHLIAEYRELPRCLKQNVNIKDAPERYTLGKGHVKWASMYPKFLLDRYSKIIKEMEYRGFNARYTCESLIDHIKQNKNDSLMNIYLINDRDLNISKQRILERYKMKPNWYRWTKRDKPDWL